MLPDRSRDGGSAGAQYSLPRGTVEGTVADCLVPFLLKAGNTWLRQRQEWDDHLKRKEISLPASSQHTLVHGGATGSLSQTLHLCNVLGQLLILAFPPPPACFQLFSGEEPGSMHSARAGKRSLFALNHSPSLLCGRGAAPLRTPGKDVVTGGATRAGRL